MSLSNQTMTTMTDPAPPIVQPRRYMKFALGIAALICIGDVLTKTWATQRLRTEPINWFGGFVRLTESRNAGAAFGLGTSITPVLTVIALVAFAALVVAAGRTVTLASAVLVGTLLGGVAGNLIDRLTRQPAPFRGHVVDWIDVGAWPTFNLADSSLVVGAFAFVWLHARSAG